MKLIFVLTAVALAQAASLDRVYLPSNAQGSDGTGSYLQTPYYSPTGAYVSNTNTYAPSFIPNANGYSGAPPYWLQRALYYSRYGRPERLQAFRDRNAATLQQDNWSYGDIYAHAHKTDNGIYAEESGVTTNGVEAQGGYTYTGDDGKVYTVRYTADGNGFVPQGDHLPTPPPIPDAILRSLEKNARDEAAGIYDDGSYIDDSSSGQRNRAPYYYPNFSGAVTQGYLPPHIRYGY